MVDEVVRIELEGAVDAGSQDEFARQLDAPIDAGATRVILNLSRLRFINSSGLGNLVRIATRAKKTGREIVLSEPSKHLKTTIETLGLDHIFKVFPDDAAAFAYFGADGP